MGDNSIRDQWDDASDSWADFVRTGKDWTRDEMNNPAMFDILGDIKDKKILDLACGEGFNSRIMARKGANVTGVDFSNKMIELAIEEEKREKLGIDYLVSNANDLSIFDSQTFDIIACFMALQDIEDYTNAIKEASRVLKNAGRFVFVIPHPCFEARKLGEKIVSGWVYEKDDKIKSTEVKIYGDPTRDALHFKVDDYFNTHPDDLEWNMKRLAKPFVTTAFHRTLTDYFRELHKAGFMISRLEEPKPTKKGLEEHPDYFKGNLRIPQFIVFEAVKC